MTFMTDLYLATMKRFGCSLKLKKDCLIKVHRRHSGDPYFLSSTTPAITREILRYGCGFMVERNRDYVVILFRNKDIATRCAANWRSYGVVVIQF